MRCSLFTGYNASSNEKYHVEMNQRQHKKKVDYVIRGYLNEEFNNPWRLTRICSVVIRQCLYSQVKAKAVQVPLPAQLKERFLSLRDRSVNGLHDK